MCAFLLGTEMQSTRMIHWFLTHSEVMTSLLWTPLRFTCWAVWPDGDTSPSPAEELFLQTETCYKTRTVPVIPTPVSRRQPEVGLSAHKEATLPRQPSASGQWTPSCCLPRSSEWSTHRCTQARTTERSASSSVSGGRKCEVRSVAHSQYRPKHSQTSRKGSTQTAGNANEPTLVVKEIKAAEKNRGQLTEPLGVQTHTHSHTYSEVTRKKELCTTHYYASVLDFVLFWSPKFVRFSQILSQ